MSWVEVARVEEIPEDEVLARGELVVWRAADGSIVVQESRCPHAWASLRGSQVRNGCIQCPFHGWRFDPAGWHLDFWGLPAGRERLRTYPARVEGGAVLAQLGPEASSPSRIDSI